MQVLSCTCCDGHCGPNNGCNCPSCFELDKVEEELQARKASLPRPSTQIIDSWTWGPQPGIFIAYYFPFGLSRINNCLNVWNVQTYSLAVYWTKDWIFCGLDFFVVIRQHLLKFFCRRRSGSVEGMFAVCDIRTTEPGVKCRLHDSVVDASSAKTHGSRTVLHGSGSMQAVDNKSPVRKKQNLQANLSKQKRFEMEVDEWI